MKFLHISDLHFGKKMNGLSLLEDQKYWKDRFIERVDELAPDAVVIAGDVYDRSAPSDEAVKLLDEMIGELSERNVPVMMVAGNHDSGQKLEFAKSILGRHNVYIEGVLSEKLRKISLDDEYGRVNFWLLPYMFPAMANMVLGREDIREYTEAARAVLENQDIDHSERNVIIAHQNVTVNGSYAENGGSETAVGGVGGIDFTVFDGFEYAALGHIHKAQKMGRNEVRYAGSPLCYHFDEAKYSSKGAVLVELHEKGAAPCISPISIQPLHNVREIRGSLDEIISEIKNGSGEYLKVVFTDEKSTPARSDAVRAQAESCGSVVLEILSDLKLSSSMSEYPEGNFEEESTGNAFLKFFGIRNQGAEPDKEDIELINFISDIIENNDTEKTASQIADEIYAYIMKQEDISDEAP